MPGIEWVSTLDNSQFIESMNAIQNSVRQTKEMVEKTGLDIEQIFKRIGSGQGISLGMEGLGAQVETAVKAFDKIVTALGASAEAAEDAKKKFADTLLEISTSSDDAATKQQRMAQALNGIFSEIATNAGNVESLSAVLDTFNSASSAASTATAVNATAHGAAAVAVGAEAGAHGVNTVSIGKETEEYNKQKKSIEDVIFTYGKLSAEDTKINLGDLETITRRFNELKSEIEGTEQKLGSLTKGTKEYEEIARQLSGLKDYLQEFSTAFLDIPSANAVNEALEAGRQVHNYTEEERKQLSLLKEEADKLTQVDYSSVQQQQESSAKSATAAINETTEAVNKKAEAEKSEEQILKESYEKQVKYNDELYDKIEELKKKREEALTITNIGGNPLMVPSALVDMGATFGSEKLQQAREYGNEIKRLTEELNAAEKEEERLREAIERLGQTDGTNNIKSINERLKEQEQTIAEAKNALAELEPKYEALFNKDNLTAKQQQDLKALGDEIKARKHDIEEANNAIREIRGETTIGKIKNYFTSAGDGASQFRQDVSNLGKELNEALIAKVPLIGKVENGIKSLGESISNTKNKIGNSGFAQSLSHGWQRFSAETKQATDTLVGFGSKIGNVMTGNGKFQQSLGGVTSAFSGMLGPISSATAGIRQMTVAMAKMALTPLGAIIAALVLAFKSMYDWLNKDAEGQMQLAKISGYLGSIMASLGDIFVKVGKYLFHAFADAGAPMNAFAKGMVTTFKSAVQTVVNLISGLGNTIKGVFTGDWDTFSKGLSQTWDAIKGAGQTAMNALDTAWKGMQGAYKVASEGFSKMDGTDIMKSLQNINNKAKEASNLAYQQKKNEVAISEAKVKEAELDEKIAASREKIYTLTGKAKLEELERLKALQKDKFEPRIAELEKSLAIQRRENELHTTSLEAKEKERQLETQLLQLKAQQASATRFTTRMEESTKKQLGKEGTKKEKEEEKKQAKSIQQQQKYDEELRKLQAEAAEARSQAEIAAIRNDAEREREERKRQHEKTLADIARQQDEIYKKIYQDRKAAYENANKGKHYELIPGNEDWSKVKEQYKDILKPLEQYFDSLEAIVPDQLDTIQKKIDSLDFSSIGKNAEKEGEQIKSSLTKTFSTVATNNAVFQREEKERIDNLIKSHLSYIDKKLEIDKNYADEAQRIDQAIADAEVRGDQETVDKLKRSRAELEKDRAKQQADLSLEQLKMDPEYIRAFEDLDNTSTATLEHLIKMFEDAKEAAGKTLNPKDLKEYTDAIERMENEIRERDPFKALARSSKELSEAHKKVKKAEQDLETVRKGGFILVNETDKKTGEVTSHILEQKEAEDNLRQAKDEEVRATSRYSKAQQGALNIIEDLGNSISGLGDAIGGTAGKIVSLIGDVISFAAGSITALGKTTEGVSAAVAAAEKASAILAIISAALQIVQKITDIMGADYEHYDRLVAQYGTLIEVWDTLIDKKKEYINTSYGPETIKVGYEVLNLLNKQIEAYRTLGKELLDSGASVGSHSIGYRIKQSLTSSDWEDIRNAIGDIDLGGRLEGLFDLSAKQLEKLREEAPSFWAKLDDDARKYLEGIIDGADEIDDAIKQINERMTGTTSDDIFESLMDSLYEFANGSEDAFNEIENNWRRMINKMVLDNVIAQEMQKQVEEWYKKLSDLQRRRNGEMTADESAELQARKAQLESEIHRLEETLGTNKLISNSKEIVAEFENRIAELKRQLNELNSITVDALTDEEYQKGLEELYEEYSRLLDMPIEKIKELQESGFLLPIEEVVSEVQDTFDSIRNAWVSTITDMKGDTESLGKEIAKIMFDSLVKSNIFNDEFDLWLKEWIAKYNQIMEVAAPGDREALLAQLYKERDEKVKQLTEDTEKYAEVTGYAADSTEEFSNSLDNLGDTLLDTLLDAEKDAEEMGAEIGKTLVREMLNEILASEKYSSQIASIKKLWQNILKSENGFYTDLEGEFGFNGVVYTLDSIIERITELNNAIADDTEIQKLTTTFNNFDEILKETTDDTKSSFGNLHDTFMDAILDMENGAENFSKKVRETIVKDLVEKMVFDGFDAFQEDWTKRYLAALESGDEALIAELQKELEEREQLMAENAGKYAEELQQITKDTTFTDMQDSLVDALMNMEGGIEDFAENMKKTIARKLIEAFMVSEQIKPMLENLQETFNYVMGLEGFSATEKASMMLNGVHSLNKETGEETHLFGINSYEQEINSWQDFVRQLLDGMGLLSDGLSEGFSDISSMFVSSLTDMEMTAEDFAKNIGKTMAEQMLQSYVEATYQKRMDEVNEHWRLALSGATDEWGNLLYTVDDVRQEFIDLFTVMGDDEEVKRLTADINDLGDALEDVEDVELPLSNVKDLFYDALTDPEFDADKWADKVMSTLLQEMISSLLDNRYGPMFAYIRELIGKVLNGETNEEGVKYTIDDVKNAILGLRQAMNSNGELTGLTNWYNELNKTEGEVEETTESFDNLHDTLLDTFASGEDAVKSFRKKLEDQLTKDLIDKLVLDVPIQVKNLNGRDLMYDSFEEYEKQWMEAYYDILNGTVLTDKQKEWALQKMIDQMAEEVAKLEEGAKKIYEARKKAEPDTTFTDMSDSIVSSLMDVNADVNDIANDMKKTIVQKLVEAFMVSDTIKPLLEDLQKTFDAVMGMDNLNLEERAKKMAEGFVDEAGNIYKGFNEVNKPLEDLQANISAVFTAIGYQFEKTEKLFDDLGDSILSSLMDVDGGVDSFMKGISETIVREMMKGYMATEEFQTKLKELQDGLREAVESGDSEKIDAAKKGIKEFYEKAVEGTKEWRAALEEVQDETEDIDTTFKDLTSEWVSDLMDFDSTAEDWAKNLGKKIAQRIIEQFVVARSIQPLLDELQTAVDTAMSKQGAEYSHVMNDAGIQAQIAKIKKEYPELKGIVEQIMAAFDIKPEAEKAFDNMADTFFNALTDMELTAEQFGNQIGKTLAEQMLQSYIANSAWGDQMTQLQEEWAVALKQNDADEMARIRKEMETLLLEMRDNDVIKDLTKDIDDFGKSLEKAELPLSNLKDLLVSALTDTETDSDKWAENFSKNIMSTLYNEMLEEIMSSRYTEAMNKIREMWRSVLNGDKDEKEKLLYTIDDVRAEIDGLYTDMGKDTELINLTNEIKELNRELENEATLFGDMASSLASSIIDMEKRTESFADSIKDTLRNKLIETFVVDKVLKGYLDEMDKAFNEEMAKESVTVTDILTRLVPILDSANSALGSQEMVKIYEEIDKYLGKIDDETGDIDTTFKDLSSSFVSSLSDMDASADDWGQEIGKTLANRIIEQMVVPTLIEPLLQNVQSAFDNAAKAATSVDESGNTLYNWDAILGNEELKAAIADLQKQYPQLKETVQGIMKSAGVNMKLEFSNSLDNLGDTLLDRLLSLDKDVESIGKQIGSTLIREMMEQMLASGAFADRLEEIRQKWQDILTGKNVDQTGTVLFTMDDVLRDINKLETDIATNPDLKILTDRWKEINKAVEETKDGFSDLRGVLVSALTDAGTTIASFSRQIGETMINQMLDAYINSNYKEKIADYNQQWAEALESGSVDKIDEIRQAVVDLYDELGRDPHITNLSDAVKQFDTTFSGMASSWVSALMDMEKTSEDWAQEVGRMMAEKIINEMIVIPSIQPLLDSMQKVINNALNDEARTVGSVISVMVPLIQEITNTYTQFQPLAEYVMNSFGLFTEEVEESVEEIQYALQDMKSNFVSSLSDMESSAEDFAQNISKILAESFIEKYVLGDAFDARMEQWQQQYESILGSGMSEDERKKQLRDLRNSIAEARDDYAQQAAAVMELFGLTATSKQEATMNMADKITYDQADQLLGVNIAQELTLEQILAVLSNNPNIQTNLPSTLSVTNLNDGQNSAILSSLQSLTSIMQLGNDNLLTQVAISNAHLQLIRDYGRQIRDEVVAHMGSIDTKLSSLRNL